MNLLDKLKPRLSTDKISINAYSSDIDVFSKFIEFLNQKEENGKYLEEDVFSQLILPLKDIPDFEKFLNEKGSGGKKRRGRKKKMTEITESDDKGLKS